jgi:hypothetical protein
VGGLTDLQERVLVAAVVEAVADDEAGRERRWHNVKRLGGGANVRTAEALERRGLVEHRMPYPAFFSEVRATDGGVALCDSMGD